jgi:hypothetical protein
VEIIAEIWYNNKCKSFLLGEEVYHEKYNSTYIG